MAYASRCGVCRCCAVMPFAGWTWSCIYVRISCCCFLRLAGTISSAAYGLMAALFSPQHGCMTTMAAAVLPRLTLLIVGSGSPAAGKRTAAEVAADRSAALNFVKEAFRCAFCFE